MERSSNRLGAAAPSRPARLVTGIIGGMALGAPACPAGMAPEPSPADWAAPNSLAAVLTARAAFAVLPVVKSLESRLIGIVAIRNGVLSMFSIDSDDVEDDDVDVESVADDARLSKPWGDPRLCRVWGIPEISCGPTTSASRRQSRWRCRRPGRPRRPVRSVHPGWWFVAA